MQIGFVEYIPLSEQQMKYLEENDEGTEEDRERGDYTALKGLGSVVTQDDGQQYLAWITDIMGRMRIQSQTIKEGTARWVGYSLCYVVLVLQTLFFIWTYFRRVIYMAFLTIIAPLVAMTYPIDKITDGKAQAFDSWLKEYIFNLLIQPLHLLLYMVLVSAAFNLAVVNPIYSIVAVGFMMPAEKMLRSFFGFNKAQTPGKLGGAAGAALAFTGLQKMMRFGKNKNSGNSNSKGEKDSGKIKFSKSEGVNEKDTVANKVLGKNAKASGNSAKKENKTKTSNTNKDAKGQSKTNKAAVTAKPANNNSVRTNDKNPQKENKKKIKGNLGKAVLAGAKKYKRTIGKRMAKKIHEMRPIRALARGAAGIAGAATFGMAGLTLGIASGDASKAFQYTTAGVAGGYGVGKGLAGSAVDALSVDSEKIEDEMKMGYYGEDYKKVKFEESVQEMANDEGNIDDIRKLTGLSYEDSQEVLGTVGRSCYESGITDMEDIAAVYEMENQGYSRDEAIAALKFNQYLPSDLNKMGESDRQDHIDRWTREYEDDGYENPEMLANKSMEMAEKINSIKSKLKKA